MRFTNLLSKGSPPWEESNVEWTTDDGAYVVAELRTQWDYELESYYLAHCLGTKDAVEFGQGHKAFSLRDRLGFPHCTILLLANGSKSPYGGSSDLLTPYSMTLTSKTMPWMDLPDGATWSWKYKVLQVRGRNDRVARWEYYSIVRQWFKAHGGKFKRDHTVEEYQRVVMALCDTDLKYHYGYLLDESSNFFTYSFWNEERDKRMEELGLVQR